MFLTREQVINIILANTENPISLNALHDKVMEDIAGRYYFCSDYTLEDMIADIVSSRRLRYNKDTQVLRRIW